MMRKSIQLKKGILALILLSVSLCSFSVLYSLPARVQAQTGVNELKREIERRNSSIRELEKEIEVFRQGISALQRERQTLESRLEEIELTRRTLLADKSLIEEKIASADLTIRKLSLEMEEKVRQIDQNRRALASSIRSLDQQNDRSIVEIFLSSSGLSEFWAAADRLEQFQLSLKRDLGVLKILKEEVEESKKGVEKTRQELALLRQELVDKQTIIDRQRNEQRDLVAATKSQESEYQALLASKEEQQKAFQQEIQSLEKELEYLVDPNSLPQRGSSVLAWPLDSVYITQGYGITSFAASGAYGYDSAGRPNPHRGIDFRASIGTPIKAPASGTVRGAVNMDAYPGCYSYGQWVLIDHPNGLSTMYAHLSLIKVQAGQNVTTGDIIGYSGNSGYSSGPHLHFQVFARDAVEIKKFTSSRGCKQADVPLAPYEAYLNPLDYLPRT